MVLIVEEWGFVMVCMNASLLHNKASGGVRQTLGVDPSKQLPGPWEGQQHSAQSSAALSSYFSECQEFIWIKLKVSRIWLPTLQLSNLIHERDSHALAEKDKQDASTRVTRIKEIVF